LADPPPLQPPVPSPERSSPASSETFPLTAIGLHLSAGIAVTTTRVASSTTSIQVRPASSTRPPALTATMTPTSAAPERSIVLHVIVPDAVSATVTW